MAAFAVSGAGAQQPSGKVLVAYFSHSGNTREVARQISEATGGDLFEIVPATPYPTEYRAVVDQGKKEIEAGVRPALKNPVGDLSQYDVIFVGSPCWWATIAPPVATFLTSYDFAGKTVVPFMTHEGSRMGRSARFIVTGDLTQIDLARKADSGLSTVMKLLQGIDGIGMVEFDNRDIIRHRLVKYIVEAFDNQSKASEPELFAQDNNPERSN